MQSLLLLLIVSLFTCFFVYFSNYFVTVKMYFYQETNPFLQKRAFEIKPVSSCFQALYQNKTDANLRRGGPAN